VLRPVVEQLVEATLGLTLAVVICGFELMVRPKIMEGVKDTAVDRFMQV
jgi:hypothetical protein